MEYHADVIESITKMKTKLERWIALSRNIRLKNAYDELSQFLLENCQHSLVEDDIDISPDVSKRIKYCSVCFETFT